MSELIALKCSSCGGSLKAPVTQMDMRGQSAVLRPGTVLQCPHCQTEHAAGTELPRQMTVNNVGGVNFTAGGNITVNVGRDIVMDNQSTPPKRKKRFVVEFHNVIEEHFSMEEVEDLCFHFGVKADNIDGRNASSKARNLILHAQRRKRLKELLELCQELRPELDWPLYREPEPKKRLQPRPTQPSKTQTNPQAATATPSVTQPAAEKQTAPEPQPKPQPEPQPTSETAQTNSNLSSRMKSWLQKLRGG